jgi:hypothetical protein
LSNWVDFDFPSGGAAVLDRETGLVWQRKVGRFESWQFALADCFDATTGNRFGWRLPANYEAATLFEASTSAIPQDILLSEYRRHRLRSGRGRLPMVRPIDVMSSFFNRAAA